MTPHEFCIKNNACSEGLSWVKKYKTANQAWKHCRRPDWMLWALAKRGDISKTTYVELAVRFAERVLPVFEKEYPSDGRPRRAIVAAKAWLRESTEENRRAARVAADAVYAARAADAVYAVRAAANAVYGVADGADAADAARAARAADAVYAVRAAADAVYAVAGADAAERKWQANEIRKLIPTWE